MTLCSVLYSPYTHESEGLQFFFLNFSRLIMSAELCCVGQRERWWRCWTVWAKEEWRESEAKARWGGGVGGGATTSAFLRLQVRGSVQPPALASDCVCVCGHVCVHKRELQGGLDYCSKARVSVCKLSPQPLQSSVIIRTWPFCSLSSELSLSHGNSGFSQFRSLALMLLSP